MAATKQFEVFWQLLNEKMAFGEGEEVDATKGFMLEALEKAGLTGNVQPVVQAAPVVSGGAKRISGWNLYMKERMAALKDQIKSGSERLTAIGAEWKAMTKEQQAVYNTQAKGTPVEGEMQAAAPAAAGKKTGHVSGWNLYMKDRMAALKEQIKSGSERLKTIGAEWKAMTKEEQAVWNAKAK